jgi:hypothetical protein
MTIVGDAHGNGNQGVQLFFDSPNEKNLIKGILQSMKERWVVGKIN